MPTGTLAATLPATLPDGRVWPCAVRFSARARRVRLRVDVCGAATLVVPAGRVKAGNGGDGGNGRQSREALQTVLDGLSPWLCKTLLRLLGPGAVPPATPAPGESGTGATPAPELPSSISLPLCGMVWQVYVRHRPGRVSLHQDLLGMESHFGDSYHDSSRVSAENRHDDSLCAGEPRAAGGRIILSGPVDEQGFDAACCLLLQGWLKRQAGQWLEGRLRLLAARMGVDVGRVTVRAQRGRWGSCSSRGDISLNCLLLLLPLPLLDHVCIHELCHRRHMDHSRRYRAHLARHAPHWELREKALDRAWREMPGWARWRPQVE